MRDSVQNTRLLAIVAVALAIITYPVHNLQLQDNADHVLKWLYNYLIAYQPAELSDLNFPHGPLAFLQYPLPESPLFYLAMLLQSIVRIGFAFLFLRQRVVYQLRQRSWSIALLVVLLLVFDFRFSMFFLLLLLMEEFRLSRNLLYAALAALLAALALYIRAYSGIITTTAFYASLLFMYSEGGAVKSRYRWLAAAFPPLFASLIWLFLFGSMREFSGYWLGFIQLSLGNSSAVALYPGNAWWLLLPAIILMLVYLVKIPRPYLSASLLLVFLLTLKYALSRQDYGHILALIQFCCATGLFLLSLARDHKKQLMFLLPALAAFYFAFYWSNGIKTYRFTQIEPWTNASHLFTNKPHQELSAQKEALGDSYSLPLKDFAAAQSIDCYPYNYYPAMHSGLELSPRPVVQAYAAYTPWLDAQDSAHYQSAEAADILLWHDNPREDFLQLTGQYLLNMEPQAVLSMMARYHPVSLENRMLLYRQRKEALLWQLKNEKSFNAGWEQWIPVPENENAILRLKPNFQKSWSGMLKGMLLKETAVFVEYRLEDGSRRKFRLNPLNALKGIWINPFIDGPLSECRPAPVVAVRFSALRPAGYQQQISVQWQQVSLAQASATETALRWFSQCDTCRPWFLGKQELQQESLQVEPFSEKAIDFDVSGFRSDSLQLIARVSFEARNTPDTDGYAYFIAANKKGTKTEALNLNRFPLKNAEWEYYSLELPVDSATSRLQLQLVNERKKVFEVRNIELAKIGIRPSGKGSGYCF